MDIISHTLWGATIVRQRPQIYWAMFFGALPDFWVGICYIEYIIKKRFKDILNLKFFDDSSLFSFKIYYFFHNLFSGLIFLIVVYLIWPKYWLIVTPYFFHLFLDVFTHTGKWASPMFYPISKYRFRGVNWWTNKWLPTANWLALILVNLVIWLVK